MRVTLFLKMKKLGGSLTLPARLFDKSRIKVKTLGANEDTSETQRQRDNLIFWQMFKPV